MERAVAKGVLLEIPERLRRICSRQEIIKLLNKRGCDVEYALQAIMQTDEIDWSCVGGDGNMGRAGQYLYYDWDSGEVVTVPRRSATLTDLDNDYRTIFGKHRDVIIVSMVPVWLAGQRLWTRKQVWAVIEDRLGEVQGYGC